MKPLCVDLYCGLGGWSEGFLAEGYECVGFDIERHNYGSGGYPGQLVLQDVTTLHGAQFKDAACIVASPPCQAYSYMAMPWKRAKAMAAEIRESMAKQIELNRLFWACFDIQAQASRAAGRLIPLIIENVKGAQPWVGQAKANYGSYYLWGDIESVGGRIVRAGALEFGMPAVRAVRIQKFNPDGTEHLQGSAAQKVSEYSDPRRNGGKAVHLTSPQENAEGVKQRGEWWHDQESMSRRFSSKSTGRKVASALIAKIPFELSSHIARVYKPEMAERASA